MMAACKVSVKHGFLKKNDFSKIKNLYDKLGLEADIKKYLNLSQISNFINIMKKDKKNSSNNINLILLAKIGKALIYKTKLEKTLIPFIKKELKNV